MLDETKGTVPLPMIPVKGKKKDSFLMTMFKGYLTAQCIGFGLLILTTPTFTMGATTRGRAQLKTRYLTAESTDLASSGFKEPSQDMKKEPSSNICTKR